MNYYTFQATGPLKDYVKHFWVLEGQATVDKPYVHHFFADTCPELLFYYTGNFYAYNPAQQADAPIKSGITGQSQQGRKLTSTSQFAVFGVYLYPYAAAHLFGIGAVELKNQMLDLKTILGKEADELEDKMMLASHNELRLQIIRSYLEKKLRSAAPVINPIWRSMQQIQKQNGFITIEELAADYSLSPRQFERNFQHFCGLNPKLFARIVRFQSAVKQLNHAGNSLTNVAYEANYYDQAHFIRDFKIFSGLKPKEFLKYHQKNSLWLTQ
jgi:AraC-like DNA-binding protein